MDFADIIQFCANVGFPIVFCFILFFQIKDMNEKIEAQTIQLVTTINDLKNEIIRLSEKIENLERHIICNNDSQEIVD